MSQLRWQCSRWPSSRGTSWQALDCLSLLLDCQERLAKDLNGVAEEATLQYGSIEKAFVDISHLCKVKPEMTILDHPGVGWPAP